jgi:hypothetical protein
MTSNNKPTILYRKGVISRQEQAAELDAITQSDNFSLIYSRTDLLDAPGRTLVIPRFFLWPHHTEVIQDIENIGHEPINSAEATSYLRDILTYQEDLGPELTPWSYPWNMFVQMQLRRTNIATSACPWKTSGGFVLKTREKSMKERWATHMFAQDFDQTKSVAANLFAAGHSPEGIVVRPHVLLNKLSDDTLPGNIPASEEYRVFVLDGNVLVQGHYWPENTEFAADRSYEPFLESVITKLNSQRTMVDGLRFYVIDIAKTLAGDWIVIELNDGCSAGLPADVSPQTFYDKLHQSLTALSTNTKQQ